MKKVISGKLLAIIIAGLVVVGGVILGIASSKSKKKPDIEKEATVTVSVTASVTTEPSATPTAAPTAPVTPDITDEPTPTMTPDPTATPTPTPDPYAVLDTVHTEQYGNRAYYEGTVTKDASALRKGPGTKDYPEVKLSDGQAVQANTGTKVRVLGEAIDADSDIWYHVVFEMEGETVEGYLYSGRVKRSNTKLSLDDIPEVTATPTPTVTPTNEPTKTDNTPTPTVTVTATPTLKPTSTPTVKPEPTKTGENELPVIGDITPTPKPTSVPGTPTVTPTPVPVFTPIPTFTPTPMPSPTPVVTLTPTPSPSAKPTATPTPLPELAVKPDKLEFDYKGGSELIVLSDVYGELVFATDYSVSWLMVEKVDSEEPENEEDKLPDNAVCYRITALANENMNARGCVISFTDQKTESHIEVSVSQNAAPKPTATPVPTAAPTPTSNVIQLPFVPFN